MNFEIRSIYKTTSPVMSFGTRSFSPHLFAYVIPMERADNNNYLMGWGIGDRGNLDLMPLADTNEDFERYLDETGAFLIPAHTDEYKEVVGKIKQKYEREAASYEAYAKKAREYGNEQYEKILGLR